MVWTVRLSVTPNGKQATGTILHDRAPCCIYTIRCAGVGTYRAHGVEPSRVLERTLQLALDIKEREPVQISTRHEFSNIYTRIPRSGAAN